MLLNSLSLGEIQQKPLICCSRSYWAVYSLCGEGNDWEPSQSLVPAMQWNTYLDKCFWGKENNIRHLFWHIGSSTTLQKLILVTFAPKSIHQTKCEWIVFSGPNTNTTWVQKFGWIQIQILFRFINFSEYKYKYYLECHFCTNMNTNTWIIRIIPSANTNDTECEYEKNTLKSNKYQNIKQLKLHTGFSVPITTKKINLEWNSYSSVSKVQPNSYTNNIRFWKIMQIWIRI